MSNLSLLGDRQQQLLTALLHNREGMTVENLAATLSISRNAVNQHLNSLETAGLVGRTSFTGQRGRPSRLYQLSPLGLEIFPRHYPLVSQHLLRWMFENLGESQLIASLRSLGESMAAEYKERVNSAHNLDQKMAVVVDVMQSLGYEAHLRNARGPEIIATNCVFHRLAEDCEQVCEIDLALLGEMLDADIEHKECMVRGGHCCRFAIAAHE